MISAVARRAPGVRVGEVFRRWRGDGFAEVLEVADCCADPFVEELVLLDVGEVGSVGEDPADPSGFDQETSLAISFSEERTLVKGPPRVVMISAMCF